MVYIEADNILSPLGMSTEQNIAAVVSGQSALRAYTDRRGLLEPYTASLFTREQWQEITIQDLSPFESLVVSSAQRALTSADIDVASPRTVLIVSSTKGNVEQLNADTEEAQEQYLGRSAERIASQLGVTTTPVTVCNACISGLSAIILAQRLLEAGDYDHAIVCGADHQSEFIISGFQSLKALSPKECRPFDMERTGLNLGEAAATIILSRLQTQYRQWAISRGSIHNDAYHTTQPAKRGDGLLLCLKDLLTDVREESETTDERKKAKEEYAQINAHGTATLFNDQMESVAIERAGLTDTPVNALKGYFGHTMGAAGILETIVTMHALDRHIIIGTRGYGERGVSGHVRLSAANLPTDKTAFIKTISGFGGCNAAILLEKGERRERGKKSAPALECIHHARITPQGATLDEQTVKTEGEGLTLLTNLYKATGGNYPKFYKMDALSRLGYIATELLYQQPVPIDAQGENLGGLLFFNRSSSIASDKKYLASIADKESYFPSPSVFIYTLPNIVTGEIAIRHNCHGETSFYILSQQNKGLQEKIVRATLSATKAQSIITGWLDYESETSFEADLRLYINKV